VDLHPGQENCPFDLKPTELDPVRRAFHENKEWYLDLIEHSQDLLCLHDLEGRLLSVNQASARMLGYDTEEILRIPMRELIAPEYRAQFNEYLAEIERKGEAHGLMVVMTRSGERRIWEYSNTLRRQGTAKPIVSGIARDLTEQKRAEKMAQEAHQNLIAQVREGERTIRELKLFRALVDQSNDAIEVVDPETLRFLDINEKACASLGYTREELLALRVFDINPEITEGSVAKIQEKLKASGYFVMESVHLRKDGSTFPVEVSMKWVHLDRSYVVVITRDLTERKRAEARMRANEVLYRTLYDGSPVGVCRVESNTGRFLGVNPKYCEITGLTEQELLGRDFRGITHPDDLSDNLEKLRQLRAAEVRHYELEKRYIRPDGSVRWVEVEIVAMWAPGENPTWHMAIAQDITDRKLVEEALRTSERQQRKIAEQLEMERARLIEAQAVAKVGSWEVELPAHEVTWSEQTHRIFETDPSRFQPTGRGFFGFIHPEDRAKMEAASEASISNGGPSTVEYRIVMPDGRVKVLEGHWKVFHDGEGRPVRLVGTCRDITERKQTEEDLRRGEEKYRLFVSQSSEGIFREEMDKPVAIDLEEDELIHHILHDTYMGECNDALARMYGLQSGKELVGKRLSEMVPPEDPCNIELTREYIRSGFRLLERESHEVDVHGNPKVFLNSMIGTVENGMLVRTWGVQRDITEKVRLEEARKQAEEALRESEKRERARATELQTILDTLPIPVLIARDPQCSRIDANRAGARYLGVPEGANISLTALAGQKAPFHFERDGKVIPPEQLLLQRTVQTKVPVQDVPTKLVFADGTEKYELGNAAPLLDEDGRLRGAVAAAIDITERVQAEQALQHSEQELRLAKEKLAEEKLYLEESIDTELGFGEIVGRSDVLKQVMQKVAKVAPSNATVLLLGETGTGKELVARALHHRSKRDGKSFIKVNCAAIPLGLLESELFGHEKGAFTGAIGRKLGRLELADGGTLFLDEIGEIPLSLQPKLLRVLQDMEFERLGGTQTLKVNVRLVAATNRDLLQATKANEFRCDLYYRLNVFPILIPPLRERREDIRPLVEHFVRKFSAKMKKAITSIPSKTMELLVRWEWPGNIRELENFVERSVILTSGSVLQAPLAELENKIEIDDSSLTLRERHRERIIRALQECHGKLGGADGAAARLGLKRTTLQSKLDHLGIKPRTYR
jgi:PAS domain S-box-containing protein